MLNFNSKNKRTGFTLIELLVVVSIIGMLSSIVMSSINTSKMKARDVRRIQDLKQIQIALEMYRNDKGKYPAMISASSFSPTWVNLAKELVGNKYISNLPTDPINNGSLSNKKYTYTYYASGKCSDGKCYDLVAGLEDPDHPLRCEKKLYISRIIDDVWCLAINTPYKNLYSSVTQ
jgi:type II secretion system protein G